MALGKALATGLRAATDAPKPKPKLTSQYTGMGAVTAGGAFLVAPEESQAGWAAKFARLGFYGSQKESGGLVLYTKEGQKVGDYEYWDEAFAEAMNQSNKLPESGAVIDAPTVTKAVESDYRGGHSAPIEPEYASMDDMSRTYPADIYSANGTRYYGDGQDFDQETMDIIQSVYRNPDAEVTIYRAVPRWAGDEIQVGDWVTPNINYARLHGEGLGEYKILKSKVKAGEIRTEGNSIHEFGYAGPLLDVPAIHPDAPKRLKAQGFDTEIPYYHSTEADIEEIDLQKVDIGFHVGTKAHANNRASGRAFFRDTPFNMGANIMPLYIKKGNVLELPDAISWNDSVKVLDILNEHLPTNVREKEEFIDMLDNAPFMKESVGESPLLPADYKEGDVVPSWSSSQQNKKLLKDINSFLRKEGYDTIRYKNSVESDIGRKSDPQTTNANALKTVSKNEVDDFDEFTFYHGTGAEATIRNEGFDLNKQGSETDHGFLGRGVYISDKAGATKYAKENSTGQGSLIGLKRAKGKYLQVFSKETEAASINDLMKALDKDSLRFSPREVRELRRKISSAPDKADDRLHISRLITEILEEKGYIGVDVFNPNRDLIEAVVFNPKNLRAADETLKVKEDQSLSYIVLDPKNVRSVHAQGLDFQTGKLLASGSPIGIAAVLGTSVYTSDSEAIPLSRAGKIVIQAYHGTPHKVDRFRSDKINTGEGAQAYGYGLYFADRRGVGAEYRDRLSKPYNDITGPTGQRGEAEFLGDLEFEANKAIEGIPEAEEFGGIMLVETLARQTFDAVLGRDDVGLALTKSDIDEKIKFFRKNRNEMADMQPFEVDVTIKLLERAKQFDIKVHKGNLYEVEIDAAPDELLDWDKPLNQQSKKVQDAVLAVRRQAAKATEADDEKLLDELFDGDPPKPEGPGFKESTLRMLGKQAYYRSAPDATTQKAASDALLKQGIKGIQFLDGVSRNKPLKDIKRKFLDELPEDADFDEVMELVEEGYFSPDMAEVLRALEADDYLGFDYPSQGISAAYGDNIGDYDPSQRLLDAIAATRTDLTRNYVVFDDKLINIITENDVLRGNQ